MIKTLQIKNFQAHRDSLLKLEPGVNVVFGLSDSGKSSTFRALKALFEKDSFYLTNGQDIGSVFVEFDDYTICREFKKSKLQKCPSCKEKISEEDQVCSSCGEFIGTKSGSDSYTVLGEDKPIEKFGTKIPQNILEKTKIFPISFVDFEININMSSQHEDMFFIGLGTSGTQRNKIISTLVVDSSKIDLLVKNLRSEQIQTNSKMQLFKEQLATNTNKIELTQTEVENLKVLFQEFETLEKEISVLQQRTEDLHRIKTSLEKTKRKAGLLPVVDKLSRGIDALSRASESIVGESSRIDSLERLRRDLDSSKKYSGISLPEIPEVDFDSAKLLERQIVDFASARSSYLLSKNNVVKKEYDLKKADSDLKVAVEEFEKHLDTDAICPLIKDKYCEKCKEILKNV